MIYRYGEIFDGEIQCGHEQMETIEEYDGSPFFVKHCPTCGHFETKKYDRLEENIPKKRGVLSLIKSAAVAVVTCIIVSFLIL